MISDSISTRTDEHGSASAAKTLEDGDRETLPLEEGDEEASRRLETCETCGNTYDKCFEVRIDGRRHAFDCFECAIHALAPRCAHCGCRIIGHGIESDDAFYCCGHCAHKSGVRSAKDRVHSAV